MSRSSDSKSIVYFWPDKLLYISDDPGRGMRYHENAPARILSFGLRGPITVDAKKPVAIQTDVSSVFHQLNSSWGEEFSGDLVCNLLVDPASVLHKVIGDRMQDSTTGLNTGFTDEAGMAELMQSIYDQETEQKPVSQELARRFGINEDASWIRPGLDRRINRVIEALQGNLSKKQSIKDLASLAGLSESRLHFLFKDEIGVSVSRYILWRRFYSVCKLMLAERNMLRAALAVGFWDAAHMSHTLKSLIGVPPSYLLRTALSSKRLLVSSID